MTTRREGAQRTPGRVDRRTMMAGGLGVLSGATLAQAAPAQAANGDPVRLGQDNTETACTSIRNTKTDGLGLRVTARGPNSAAVEARSPNRAIHAEAKQGTGVRGVSETGDGVAGQSETGAGVNGFSFYGFGVVGEGKSAAGVVGNSPVDSGVVGSNVATDKPAVLGWAQNGGTGVTGLSAGPGAIPPGGSNTGVHGVCDAPDGTGVLARSSRGVALRVEGRAVFRRSGVLRIGAGARSATKTGIPLTAASLVLATLRQHQPGLHIEAAVPSPAKGSFTIYLNRQARAESQVAWLVVN